MIYNITYVKDTIGDNFIGIDIPVSVAKPFVDEMCDIIGDGCDSYKSNQSNRDHGLFHLTIMNVAEFNRLSKDDDFIKNLGLVFDYDIDDLKMLGVGTAVRNENRAYFIVCKSDKLDAVRKRYGLEPRDLHVTLGFLYKDIFGVRKNEVIKKENRFLQLLSIEYYKKENWNFINRIGNFDFDLKSEVIPVKISKSSMRFKCEGYYIDVILLDDIFWIGSKYLVEKEKELFRIPETEIIKVLKN